MLCRACNAVVCQQCAGVTENQKKPQTCSKCGKDEGLDWALPFVYCDKCGKRAAVISLDIQKEAIYLLLDKGALPVRCFECHSINCTDCLSKNKNCQKCGSSKLDLFVPGYLGKGVIIAKVDSSGDHITLAAPGSPSAERVEKTKSPKLPHSGTSVEKRESSIANAVKSNWNAKMGPILGKFHKVYSAPDIPEKLLERARAKFAPTTNEESIIAFFDETFLFWTKGKRGTIVTTHGIYWRYGELSPGHVTYKEIVKQELHIGGTWGMEKDHIFLSKKLTSTNNAVIISMNISKHYRVIENIEAIARQFLSFIKSAVDVWASA